MHSPDRNAARRLLSEILSEYQSLNGAQLKLQLIAAAQRSGLGQFDESQWGYEKFSEFLADACHDLVTLDCPIGASDIRVSLVGKRGRKGVNKKSIRTQDAIRIRNDVWQAFTNPDPKRKRYITRDGATVCHFLPGQSSSIEQDVLSNRSAYVEIDAIPPETQQEWMRKFIEKTALAESEKETISQLLGRPYSSFVNVTFTRALGDYGDDWREFRINRVLSLVRAWAEKNGIPFEHLKTKPSIRQHVAASTTSSVTGSVVRARLNQVLTMVSDDDIRQVLLPAAMACVLLESGRALK